MQACSKTHHFEIKNAKIFWEGDTPSPDLTPFVASIFAPTALKLNVIPPEKNPGYGLGQTGKALDTAYKR